MFYSFQKREMPEEIREFRFSFAGVAAPDTWAEEDEGDKLPWRFGTDDFDVCDILVETGQVKSRSEANRLIRQGAVSIDGKKITSNIATVESGSVIKVGKRRFAKVINSDILK